MLWTGLVWLRIGTGGELLWTQYAPSGSIKCWELPSGCTSCGPSSGTQLHRVSYLVPSLIHFYKTSVLTRVSWRHNPEYCILPAELIVSIISRDMLWTENALNASSAWERFGRIRWKQFRTCTKCYPITTQYVSKGYSSVSIPRSQLPCNLMHGFTAPHLLFCVYVNLSC
jgi:hypothetical protein